MFAAPPRVHVLHVPGAIPERDEMVRLQATQADLCVHEDRDPPGYVTPNWLTALDCAARTDGTKTSWSLIIQDDALPLPGWQQHAERACTNSPSPLLGLFHIGGWGAGLAARGAAYGIGSYLIWGCAAAYHSSTLRGLYDWASRIHDETGYRHDDVLACAYAMKMGWTTSFTTHSLFDHPLAGSLMGHNFPNRRPGLTIEGEHPQYASKTRSLPAHRSINPKGELERLAAL
jgi:hypothetical protein